MQAARKQWRQGLVDEAMTLQRPQPDESTGHNPQPKVPLAGTGVAHVRGALVLDLEVSRPQLLPEQLLDGQCGGRSGGHEMEVARTSGREASQAAWAMAKSAKANVRPKNLKFTQSRSLRW